MDEFEQSLEAAGARLQALANGPAREAAESMERHFDEAGRRIEAALAKAARTGELDFSRMAEAVLRDLARIAAEAAIAGGRRDGPADISLTLAGAPSVGARGVIASQGAVAAALARAVSAGGRFL